jgi:arginase
MFHQFNKGGFLLKIHIFGIASSAGALYEGTELAPNAIREANLIRRLENQGFVVKDYGDITNSDGLTRHNVGPIRNWPAPRMVWESIDEQANRMFQPNSFSIILGGDCSIEVGTFTAFRKVYGDQSHLLVLDGHVDTVEPHGERCIGAAGMGLWFLTKDNKVWWNEEPISENSVSIIGPHALPDEPLEIKVLPHEELSNMEKVSHLLKDIPEDAPILVHLDVDVLHESIMPAAYSPSNVGLNLQQAATILSMILTDPRVKGIEVTEFSANKDADGSSAKTIVDLLCLLGEQRD